MLRRLADEYPDAFLWASILLSGGIVAWAVVCMSAIQNRGPTSNDRPVVKLPVETYDAAVTDPEPFLAPVYIVGESPDKENLSDLRLTNSPNEAQTFLYVNTLYSWREGFNTMRCCFIDAQRPERRHVCDKEYAGAGEFPEALASVFNEKVAWNWGWTLSRGFRLLLKILTGAIVVLYFLLYFYGPLKMFLFKNEWAWHLWFAYFTILALSLVAILTWYAPAWAWLAPTAVYCPLILRALVGLKEQEPIEYDSYQLVSSRETGLGTTVGTFEVTPSTLIGSELMAYWCTILACSSIIYLAFLFW